MITDIPTNNQWAKEFFNNSYFCDTVLKKYAESKEFDGSVSFLIKELNLPRKNATIFDQCCGTGSYSLEIGKRLQDKSSIIFGVDISDHQISNAESNNLTKNCCFSIGDAYQYITPMQCDAAYNINSSFGYSDTDEENIKMLQRVYDSLKNGGKFILEYPNTPYLKDNFISILTETYDAKNGKKVQVTWNARIEDNKLYKDYSFGSDKEDPVIKCGGGMKLYTPADLKIMLSNVGFGDFRIFGNLNGEKFSENNSPRYVISSIKI